MKIPAARILHWGPGLRVIKTGMAVTVCVCISHAAQLGHPLLTALAAAAVMGKTIDDSLHLARDGTVGSLLGAVFGLLLSLGNYGNAALCGIGLIAVLYLCVLLRLGSSVLLAETVLLFVMLVPGKGSLWLNASLCAAETLLGVAVGLAVNLVILPHHAVEEIRENLKILRALTAQSLHAVRAESPAPLQELESCIEKLSASIRAYVSQRKLLRGSDEEVFRLTCILPYFREFAQELNCVQSLRAPENARLPDEDLAVLRRYHMSRLESLALQCLPDKEDRREERC